MNTTTKQLYIVTEATRYCLQEGQVMEQREGRKLAMRNWDDTLDFIKVVHIDTEKDLVTVEFTDRARQTMSLAYLCENIEVHEIEAQLVH